MQTRRSVRNLIRIAVTAAALAVGFQIASVAEAIDCSSDCNRECKIGSAFGKNIYNPQCKLSCEAYKKGCRVTGGNLPPALGIPTNPLNMQEEWCKRTFEGIRAAIQTQCFATGYFAPNPNIERARQQLVDHNFFTSAEVGRVEIRFCKLAGRGAGLTASTSLVFIDDSYARAPFVELAAIIGHEFFHVRQLLQMGDSEFKCRYARGVVGLVGRGSAFGPENPMERPAYEYQHRIQEYFERIAISDQSGTSDMRSSVLLRAQPDLIESGTTQPWASRCLTGPGWCLHRPGPTGGPCICRTPYGVFNGRLAL